MEKKHIRTVVIGTGQSGLAVACFLKKKNEEFQGLYFAGIIFQFGLTTGLVGGVGRDAAYVVNHLHKRSKK